MIAQVFCAHGNSFIHMFTKLQSRNIIHVLSSFKRKRSVQRPISSVFFYNLTELSRSPDCYSTSSWTADQRKPSNVKSNGLVDSSKKREFDGFRERRELSSIKEHRNLCSKCALSRCSCVQVWYLSVIYDLFTDVSFMGSEWPSIIKADKVSISGKDSLASDFRRN